MDKQLTDKELLELKNLEKVCRIVTRSENPHPLTIVLIIFASIIVIYYIYICMIKDLATGNWVDENKKKYTIKHNKWTDAITVNTPKRSICGVIKGNLIVIYVDKTMRTGVWLNDTINWTDGTTWQCIYGYKK